MKDQEMLIEQNNQIVFEMMRALGGKRFLVMTGSKPTYKKVSDTRSPEIGFKLARNKSKCNHMRVIYNYGADLYEIEFLKITTKEFKVVEKFTGVYNDMLEEIFSDYTGLCTRL